MNLFAKGQRIALYFDKDTNVVEMTCIIENVYNDRLSLELPQYFMRYINSLQEGCELSARAFSKLGTIDFNTVVISSPLEETFDIELDYNAIKLTESNEISTIKAVIDLEIKTSEEETIKAKTYEISTEFLRFYSNKEFKINTSCDFTIFLPKGYGIIKFNGIITENDPIYDNEYTVKYYFISDADKQSLLYYMYMYSTSSE